MPNIENEPWRRLGYSTAPETKPYLVNVGIIKANLDQMQEARCQTLMRDFDYMQAWQLTDTTYVVVNFKSISLTDVIRGRYDVDMAAMTCNCRDQFYTYADEGSGVFCKHVLYVASQIGGDP